MSIVFQHLDTVNPAKSSSIYLFGRTVDGKSVAALINDIRPHLCITIPRSTNLTTFRNRLTENLARYHASSSAIYSYKDNKRETVPIVSQMMEKYMGDHMYLSVEELEGQDIVNYSEAGPRRFVRIRVKNKWVFKKLRDVLTRSVNIVTEQFYEQYINDVKTKVHLKEKEKVIMKKQDNKKYRQKVESRRFYGEGFTIYNDQVDFMLQYLIDKKIYSCSFIKASGKIVEGSDKGRTSCDIELTVDSIHQVECNDITPWRVLSYDIESLPPPNPDRPGKYLFPVSENDPIITIGGVLQTGKDIEQYVWILRKDGEPVSTLAKIDDESDYDSSNTVVYDFDDEFDMIKHFIKFIIDKDVDFLEGHNINRFDNAYVLERYEVLYSLKKKNSITPDEFKFVSPVLGRIKDDGSYIIKKTFSSNQKGAHEQFKLHFPGRVVIDSYDVMKSQHNESSYKLDNLALKYLGTKKVDQDYADINPQYQTRQGRHDLAVYCVKDSWLVRKLMEKLCKLTVFLQMANVTGISMKDVIERGQGIRTIGLMLRYCMRRQPEYFIPRLQNKSKYKSHNIIGDNGRIERIDEEQEQSFQGATVIEPDTGFYKNPVCCLDFASLYPSIMQCLNMSYETLVSTDTVKRMDWKELGRHETGPGIRSIPDYSYVNMKLTTTINHNNPIFVTKDVRKGLLPEMLETVLTERRLVKKQMKKCKDEGLYKVLDGRQLGLKVVANSMYGFTGATFGFLPEKRIASSVTKYGRGMILRTKNMIENHPEWGKKHGVKCIYGDTDSVFCHLPRSLVDGKTTEELIKNAHDMGTRMAEHVTSIFLPPNDLEYEKTYYPYLLLKKKRYAGKKFEPGQKDKVHIKGLEAARRDFAPLLVDTQKEMLRIIIEEQDVPKASAYVKQIVADLFNNKIPLDKLILSKKLSRPPDQYKVKSAHVQLAERLAIEKPETAPVSGDRVAYCIYAGGGKTSQRACTPAEIKSGRFQIDRSYYMEKQLKPPLLRILAKVVKDPSDLFTIHSITKPKISANSIFGKWLKRKPASKHEEEQPQKKSRLNFLTNNIS